MEGINVFMMDPTYVDLDVFALWLKGYSGTYKKTKIFVPKFR